MEEKYIELLKEIVRNSFITSNLIRAGSIFLTIFLIKHFISFYKYNIRLSSFYESRARALQLSGIEDLKRVEVFIKSYATDSIQFENDDTLKELVELIKQAKDK